MAPFYSGLLTGIFIGFFLGLIFAAMVMLGKINERLRCLYFHKKYHKLWRDRGSAGTFFTIIECSKCRKNRVVGED